MSFPDSIMKASVLHMISWVFIY